MWLPLLVLLAACAIALVLSTVKNYLGLRDFGGHWSAGWSRIWLLRTQQSGNMHHIFAAMTEKYGSTVRIGPRLLLTSDPDLMRRMNAVRSPFTRGPWYAALKLHPERDNITSYVDEQKHADLRSRMAPGYSGKENTHMEQDVDTNLLQFLDLVDQKYVSEPEQAIFRQADLSRLTTFFTLDVISTVAFGESFGFLTKDEDPFGYIANLELLLPAIILTGVYTELTNLLRIPLIKASLPKSTDKRGLGRVMGFARDRVRERFGDKPIERQDMLNAFIKRGLSQEELESETLTQITAGSDSTASALRTTLHYISTTPAVLIRLLSEFQHAIDRGRITRPIVLDAEARRLPYLQACIKEGLRMYPPVTGLLPKLVPKGGARIVVDGKEKFAPAGTQIGWNSWGMMRDKIVFGDDCEVFRPERWLPLNDGPDEAARVTRMTDVVTMCFGYGRFGCLGRGVAIMELNKGIIETLIRFDLQPCNLARPFSESCVGFWIHRDMNFVIRRRKAWPLGGESGDLQGVSPEVAALPGVQEA